MVVNLQKEVLGMNQWLERICRQSGAAFLCERPNRVDNAIKSRSGTNKLCLFRR